MGNFNDDTFFLFASPTFISGIAAVLDLGSGLIVYNESITGKEADERALASDWAVVGKDIASAIETFEEKEACHA
jgi:hypothetical protein